MRRYLYTASLILPLIFFSEISIAQLWTAKTNYGGTPRNRAAGFSIPSIHKLYIVGGYDFTYEQDTWEYDTLTNAWTQKANFPGGPTSAVAFSINGKGYTGTGVNGGYLWYNSFYEYDPATNTWTPKANFPGGARGYSVGFATTNKGYIGGGFTGTPGVFVAYNDFYEYDPVTDTWTQIADYPGAGAALGASGFSVNDRGYVGCGSSIDVNGTQALHNDFWEYDPSTNTWIQKADFAGGIRGEATSFTICEDGFIGLGYDVPHASFENDFWKYNPSSNTWNATANYGGSARAYAPGSAIGKSGYAGTGSDGITNMNDFWEYHDSYVADFIASTDSICAGDSISFTDQSSFSATSWSWNFPGGNPLSSSQQNPVVTYDVPGTYNVTMTAYSCDSAIIIKTNYITVTSVPVKPDLGNDTTFCGNFSLTLSTGAAGFQYLWSTGDTTSSIDVTTADTFSVSVFNSCGTEADTIIITAENFPSVFIGNDTTVCDSAVMELNAEGDAESFLWSTGETDSFIVINAEGIYWVDASNACGTASDTIEITLILPPLVNLGNDTSLCDFTNFFLKANTSADFYSWSNGETGDSIQVLAPGIYSVAVSNICGASSDTIVITPCGAEYLVPSAFSPNGDGTNDLLSLIKIGNASLIDFKIFSRWGELIFHTKDETQGWNGTFKGLEEEIAVFVFLLKYRDNDSGKESTAAGNITLIR